MCNKCCDSDHVDKQAQFGDNNKEVVNMNKIVKGNKVLFVSASNEEEIDEEILETEICIMFPKNSQSTENVEQLHLVKGRPGQVGEINQAKSISMSNIKGMYENQLNKYKLNKEAGDRYVAVIKDVETKKLGDVSKVTDDFRITGSTGWFETQIKEVAYRQDQYGSFHLSVKLDIPKTQPEILGTALVQEGYVVSVDKIGLGSGELKVQFMVHLDHKSEDDCTDECDKMELEEFVEKNLFDVSSLGNKHIGTYIFSVHQTLHSFAKHIVEAPSSGLCADNYKLMIVFDVHGNASIVGLVWPNGMEAFNLALAQKMDMSIIKTDLIDFIERNVSATGEPTLLRSTFNLSEEEALGLSSLVIKNQFHHCDDDNCQVCLFTNLPSLETVVKESCSYNNLEATMRLKTLMKLRLKALPFQLKKRLTTFQWLESVWSEVIGEITDDDKKIVISFEEDIIEVEIDERLTAYLEEYSLSPLTATYHYALSCLSCQDESQVVLKRMRVIDCYIEPFNPLYLKSFTSAVSIAVVNNAKKFEKFLSRSEQFVDEEPLADHKLIFSHKITSLSEAVSLTDKNKQRVKSNTVEVFVNAKPNRRIIVKKVSGDSPNNFTLEGCTEQYQIMSSILTE